MKKEVVQFLSIAAWILGLAVAVAIVVIMLQPTMEVVCVRAMGDVEGTGESIVEGPGEPIDPFAGYADAPAGELIHIYPGGECCWAPDDDIPPGGMSSVQLARGVRYRGDWIHGDLQIPHCQPCNFRIGGER